MAIKGFVRLEMARERMVGHRLHREVVKRVEHHNTLTGYIDGMNCEGNYGLLIPSNKLRPISQFMDGCVLTNINNDPTINMIAQNANITACAGKDGYTGTNTKRGSFNAIESGLITSPNGYKGLRRIWDWGTASGNGVISSVGLTRHQLAIAEYSTSATPAAGLEINELLYDSGGLSTYLRIIGSLHILDYDRELGYRVNYSSGTITVVEYQLSCRQNHLVTRPFLFDAADASYMPELVGNHTISQTIADYTEWTMSISYTGDKIYIITWNGSTIRAYPINIADWSIGTVIEKTFNGVTFMNIGAASWNSLGHKDVILLDGDYAWALASVGGVTKMVKVDLLGNSVAVVEKTIPFEATGYNNGCCMMMPNGDFYKFRARGVDGVEDYRCLYYHNGEFFVARDISPNKGNSANVLASSNSNIYGSILNCYYNNYDNSGALSILTTHGFLSTVFNLQEAVTKTADLTMKLTYEITEEVS